MKLRTGDKKIKRSLVARFRRSWKSVKLECVSYLQLSYIGNSLIKAGRVFFLILIPVIILKENHRFYLTQAELDGLQDELSSLWLPQKTFRIKVFFILLKEWNSGEILRYNVWSGQPWIEFSGQRSVQCSSQRFTQFLGQCWVKIIELLLNSFLPRWLLALQCEILNSIPVQCNLHFNRFTQNDLGIKCN